MISGFGFAQTHNVTFQVDMKNVTAGYTTPEVNGTFNNWCGNCNAMTDANNDSIWEITVPIPAGTIEFKYAADNWTIQETLAPGMPCVITTGSNTNRALTISGDTTLGVVCWESCMTCSTPPPSTHNVTFQVDMRKVTSAYTTPEVNGTFNNWCGNCNSLTDANNDSIWEVTLPLTSGTIEYKFAADNWTIQESLAPGMPCVLTTGATTNRVLTFSGDTTLSVVCWESCVGCNTPPPANHNVTFQVDMRNVTAAYTTPEVNGTFNSWCGNCNAMTDANSDSIWEITVPIPAGTIEFKYAADNWTIQETLAPGMPCVITAGSNTNRALTISGDTTLGVVCWESCMTCSTPPPSKPQISLPISWDDTANVDYTVTDFGGNRSSMVVDPMNASNLVLMTDKDTNAVTWAGTTLSTPIGLADSIPFAPGATLIKAVVYSPDAGTKIRLKAEDASNNKITVEVDVMTTVANGWDTLTFDFSKQATGTAVIDFSKRYDMLSIFYNFDVAGATAGNKTYYVDDVFFSAGGGNPTPPDTNTVTFKLDMNEFTGTFTTPEVNGTFNNWCGACGAMTDANNDNIWELTVDITLDTIEYKFSYDAWTGQENLDSNLTCILQTGTFVNRLLGISGDTTLPAFCWESCETCSSTSIENLSKSADQVSIFPNPANNLVNVSVTNPSGQLSSLELINSIGEVVYAATIENYNDISIDVSELQTGIYFVKVNGAEFQTVQKLLITK